MWVGTPVWPRKVMIQGLIIIYLSVTGMTKMAVARNSNRSEGKERKTVAGRPMHLQVYQRTTTLFLSSNRLIRHTIKYAISNLSKHSVIVTCRKSNKITGSWIQGFGGWRNCVICKHGTQRYFHISPLTQRHVVCVTIFLCCPKNLIFVLHGIISHLVNNSKRLFCAFIDFTKAFDLVVRDVIWYKFIKFGVRGKILDIIKAI